MGMLATCCQGMADMACFGLQFGDSLRDGVVVLHCVFYGTAFLLAAQARGVFF